MKFKELTAEQVSDFIYNDPKLVYMGFTDSEIAYMYKTGTYLISPVSNYIGIEDYDLGLVCILKWELFTVDVISTHFYIASKFQKHGLSTKIWDFMHNHFLNTTTVRKIIVFVPEPCTHVIKCTERNGFIREAELKNMCTWRQEAKSLYIYGFDIIRNGEEQNG